MTTIIILLFNLYLSYSFFFNKNNLSPDTAKLINYNLGNNILKKIKNKILNETDEYKIVEDKKIIKIAPAGLNGFYMLGICNYIRDTYDLSNYIFSGASAGAWNSLYLCYNGNITKFKETIFNLQFQNVTSVLEIQHMLKSHIIKNLNEDDFDFSKLFIGVTIFDNCGFKNTIFSEFVSLEDALDCCIASSHIPLITGGIFNIYKNLYTFDGGFSMDPYINKSETLFIRHNMWNNKTSNLFFDIASFNITDHNFTQSFIDGYNDSKNNKQILDKYLI